MITSYFFSYVIVSLIIDKRSYFFRSSLCFIPINRMHCDSCIFNLRFNSCNLGTNHDSGCEFCHHLSFWNCSAIILFVIYITPHLAHITIQTGKPPMLHDQFLVFLVLARRPVQNPRLYRRFQNVESHP